MFPIVHFQLIENELLGSENEVFKTKHGLLGSENELLCGKSQLLASKNEKMSSKLQLLGSKNQLLGSKKGVFETIYFNYGEINALLSK